MGQPEQQRALRAARRREEQGELDVAVTLYLEAGLPQEAARLRATQGRYAEASQLLLSALGVEPSRAGELEPARRKLAQLAASYLARAGQVQPAVELWIALDERARAADLLERSGDLVAAERLRGSGGGSGQASGSSGVACSGSQPEDAARCLQAAHRAAAEGQVELALQLYAQQGAFREAGALLARQGRVLEASNAFAAAGAHYEAGACLVHAGDLARGVQQLMQVPRDDPNYRRAAVQVVRACRDSGELDFQTEHFLTGFINSGPVDRIEIETFYRLSLLHERIGMADTAAELLARLLAAAGGSYRDAAQRLARLERAQPNGLAQRINQEDASFRRDGGGSAAALTTGGRMSLAELPGLPPLRDPSFQPAAATATRAGLGPVPIAASRSATELGRAGTVSAALDDRAGERAAAAASSTSFGPHAPATAVQPVADAEPARAATPLPPAAREVFAVGATIAGRYRLLSKLGEGGMAMVFCAHDSELDEEIAIKVFLQQTLDAQLQQESLARFKQELKLSRQLTHANIIRLHDIGLHQGHRYITMERLVGTTLDRLLDQAGTIGYAQGLSYLVQACAGLQAAHDRGVIHRDIKPDNLFVTDDEVVKVLDFGIAKDTATTTGQTIAGTIAGTPEYMAPEQISDFSAVCPATDLYSLGVIAYRMFTGRVPFQHQDLMKLLMMHLNDEPPPPRSLRPELPEDLEQVVLRLLAKQPEQRYATCRELAVQLQQLRRSFRR